MSEIEKNPKVGPAYIYFYKKRTMLEGISAAASAYVETLEELCLRGKMGEDMDAEIRRFFDDVERIKADFMIAERSKNE